jgi:tetratricopeptide (TPR) repeat protein
VLKALEKDPAKRYATAQELADDLQSWLEDRPIKARRPGVGVRLGKWARRHRPVVASLAAGMVALLVVGGAVWLWQVQAEAATVRAVGQLLPEVRRLYAEGRLSEALAKARRAEALLEKGGGTEALRQQVQRLLADLAMAERLEEIPLLAADKGGGGFDLSREDSGFLAEFKKNRLDVDRLAPEEVAARIGKRLIKDRLVAALDYWATIRCQTRKGEAASWQRLLQIARLADPDPWRNRIRDALEQRSVKLLRALAQPDTVAALPPSTLVFLGLTLSTTRNTATAEKVLRQAQRQHPADFWVTYKLASCCLRMQPPKTDDAIRFYTAALALRSQSPGVHVSLADALREKGRLDEAVAVCRDAIHLNKGYPEAHNSLGAALQDKGQLDEAIAAYQEAIRLKKDFPEAHYNLANALAKQGQLDQAVAAYKEALRLKKDYPEAHNNLGIALQDKDGLDEAIAAYREAIRLKKDLHQAHYNLGIALYEQGRLDQAVAAYREALRLKKNYPEALYNLGVVLADKGQLDEAIAAYQEAIHLKKDFPEAHYNLANALAKQGQLDQAVAAYKEALRLKKDYPEAHNNLGATLAKQGRLEEAVAAHREAIRLNKNSATAHNNLGIALVRKCRLDEAIAAYREAIRLKQDDPEAHSNLGDALRQKGQLDEAVAACREAIRLKQDYPEAYNNLGAALAEKGQLDEAIAAYREAIRLKKDYPWAHLNLGTALHRKGQLDEAIAAYREAIRLKQDDPLSHFNLGAALGEKGQPGEAITAFREAIRLKQDYAEAHSNLGVAFAKKGQLDKAIAAYREAIRLKEDYPEAHVGLGVVLQEKGAFAEALAALKRGHELGSTNSRWPYPSAQWVRRCDRLVQLDARLPAILRGEATPASDTERVELARVCGVKRLYGSAGRFFEEAFTASPALAQDLKNGNRYVAANVAACAGCGQGQEATKLTENERAHWRKRALNWLRADLALWTKQLESGSPQDRQTVAVMMQRWQGEQALAGLRDTAAVALLPPAEQEACTRLWTDVEVLLRKAQPRTR